MISILLHLYYPESVKSVLPQISPELLEGNKLYINLVNTSPFDLEAFHAYSNLTLVKSSNVGKDIGGKLALIDSLLQQEDDSKYWIFLHDKNSPHTSTGKFWRDSLFSIADIQNKAAILKKMDQADVSVVTHKNFINNEWDERGKRFTTVNNDILKGLMAKYSIKPHSYDFVAGTMFWAKSEALKSFFKKHNPLSIRATLERGNVHDKDTGTTAHSWERLLSWIATGNNKKIAGIG
jgi:lipopolysaccharide biosynthesis protein